MSDVRQSRGCLFRTIVVLVPLCLGLIFSIWVLISRGVLVRDDNGRISLVEPPLYLEEPGYELSGHRYLYDKVLGWRNIPNWNATTFDKPLTINSKGLRDREHQYRKPVDCSRILVLGDSYAWGYGVADDETFSHRLERLYSEKNRNRQVINTGVSGWGTDQQLLFLREEGWKYEPDVVVVAFFIGNDIDNNMAVNQYHLNKPVFVDSQLTLENTPVPKPTDAVDPVLLSRMRALDPVKHTVDILRGIAQECMGHDCKLVIMKFGNFLAPTLPYAMDLESRFESALQKAQLGAEYVDLDELFAAQGLDSAKLTNGNNDGHWNAFGHGVVAKSLMETLDAFSVSDGTRSNIP